MIRNPIVFLLCAAACGGGEIVIPLEGPNCPAPQVTSERLVFDDALFNVDVTQYLTVTNECNGDEDTEVSVRFAESMGFESEMNVASLGPRETLEWPVHFRASEYGQVQTILTLEWDVDHSLDVVVSGTAHSDQDGDGYASTEVEGDDCNDLDPNIFPGATESEDVVDNDCDGFVDEDFVKPGDIYVSEMMLLPKAVVMETGQWLELTNTTAIDRNLSGWILASSSGGTLELGEVLVPAGGRAVLAASGDPDKNGGIDVDWVYTYDAFPLNVDFGVLQLSLQEELIGYLEYDLSWPVSVGASIGADPIMVTDAFRATRGDWWCASSTTLTGGDRGTPGMSNDYCRNVDHDGDGFSEQNGDCDDAEPRAYPGNNEIWDDIDNDCDRDVDHLSAQSVEVGYLKGLGNERLGEYGYLGVGDINNDGTDELIVTSRFGPSGYDGAAHILDVEQFDTWKGLVSMYASATVEGVYGEPHFITSPRFGDNDGDGATDFVLMGIGGYSYSTTERPGLAVFTTLPSTSAVDIDDASIYIYSTTRTYTPGSVRSDLDFNGDGVAEIIYGRSGLYDTGLFAILSIEGLASGRYDERDDILVEYEPTGSASQLGAGLGGGDINADGYDDFVVRDASANYASSTDGTLYGVFGELDPIGYGDIDDAATFEIKGLGMSFDFQESASSQLVDIDGNGTLDLAFGSSSNSQVYIFFDADTLVGTYDAEEAEVILHSDAPNAVFGRYLASGDFNADGKADLAISSWSMGAYYGQLQDGEVHVFNGGDWQTLPPEEPSALFSSDEGSDWFGFGLLATDVDDDGLDDLIVSAPMEGGFNGKISVLRRE